LHENRCVLFVSTIDNIIMNYGKETLCFRNDFTFECMPPQSDFNSDENHSNKVIVHDRKQEQQRLEIPYDEVCCVVLRRKYNAHLTLLLLVFLIKYKFFIRDCETLFGMNSDSRTQM